MTPPAPAERPLEAPPEASIEQPEDMFHEEKLSITEKSALGWALLARKVADSKAFRKEQEVRSAVEESLKRPFKYVADKLDGDGPAKEAGAPEQGGFWENHPGAKGWWLGFKGAKSLGFKVLWKYPKALFTSVLLPALYSQTAPDGRMIETELVGAKALKPLLRRTIDRIRGNPLVRSCSEFTTRTLQAFPGLGIAINVLGVAFGGFRIADGIDEYMEGVRQDDYHKKIEGKMAIVAGAFYTIKPLVLLGILTEGVHLYLNHRVKHHGLDMKKLDAGVTTAFAAATAPLGLAAYALLRNSRE